jgi:hypothetical protein
VFQNLEKPIWLSKKKKFFFWVGFFHFWGILSKNRFFGLFSAKIGLHATSSIYSESAQKTLQENIHFFEIWKIRGNFAGKVGFSGIRFIQKEKCGNFFFSHIFQKLLKICYKS